MEFVTTTTNFICLTTTQLVKWQWLHALAYIFTPYVLRSI